jgi:hypothetical protein
VILLSRQVPTDRLKALQKYPLRVNDPKNPEVAQELAKFNIVMNNDMVRLDGRVLNSEKVFLGPNGSAEYKDNKADWTQGELRNLGPG